MMADNVKMPTFAPTINRVLGQAVTKVLEKHYEAGDRLRRGLKRMNNLFYRVLAQQAVGVEGPPDLGPYSPLKWDDLSDRTIHEKGHADFYYDRGNLQSWLMSASASDLLGDPIVILRTRSEQIGKIEGFTKSVVRRSTRGKVWVQNLTFSNYRATGMRGFIRRDQLLEWMQPYLSVTAFSSIPLSFGSAGDLAKWITGGQADNSRVPVAFKFLNAFGGHNRPILPHYLAWWIDVRVRRVVERFGKVKT